MASGQMSGCGIVMEDFRVTTAGGGSPHRESCTRYGFPLCSNFNFLAPFEELGEKNRTMNV